MDALLARIWYQGHWAGLALIPLAWAYRAVLTLRRVLYRIGVLRSRRLPVPVIVVGNIAAGGTGKTPLVIWLAGYLASKGMHPGVVSRGYGGRGAAGPRQVRPDSDPRSVGDEPVLIARRTAAPVTVDADRVRGARALVARHGCDVIISDDGLQHYRLARDIEIVVVDGERRHGNGRCLPAGPLREPVSRLASVDLVVANGKGERGEFPMRLVPGPVRELGGHGRRVALESFAGSPVNAVCAIGNPGRFFGLLREAGITPSVRSFPDHHRFVAADLLFDDARPILMTEKDAVKCERLAPVHAWAVSVTAELPDSFCHRLDRLLARSGGAAAAHGDDP